MAKITLKNLTQNRVHIPRPVNLSLPPQGSVTLDRISDDELARSKSITEMIQKGIVRATVADDPTVDDSIEARLLLASVGTGPTLSNLTPQPLTTVASPGLEAEASRADHSHDHGVQPGGTLHSAATTSNAGFMSNFDKQKLNSIEANATANQNIVAGTGLTGGGSTDTVTVNADFGTGAGQVVEGNDTRIPTQPENDALVGTSGSPSSLNRYVTNADFRLTDSRTPTGSASGDLNGSYPNPQVVALTEAGGPTRLTLGTLTDGQFLRRNGNTIETAAAGVVPLSDATPQPVGTGAPGVSNAASRADHIHSHGNQAGGTLHALATSINAGFMSATDKTKLNTVEANAKDDQVITAGLGLTGGGSGDVTLSVVFGTGTGQAVEGTDTRLLTQAENDAAQGTSGSPSNVNRFVTDQDTRLTNARTPTAHALTHSAAASDPITVQNLGSGAATSGNVLTADGFGGLVFQPPGTPGPHAPSHSQGGLDEVVVSDLASGSALADQVLIADGANGTFFGPVPSQWKQSVRAATTANLSLATDLENGDTLDGVTLATGDRVLVKDQTNPIENGIYVVQLTGAAVRAADLANGDSARATVVGVEEGSVNVDAIFACVDNRPSDVVGANALTFVRFDTPLTTSAPLDVDKSAALTGVSFEAARSDHKHDVSTGIPVTIGVTNSEGTATALARRDHVHAHGSQTDGSLHALATPTVAGFLDPIDKIKLDDQDLLESAGLILGSVISDIGAQTIQVTAGTGRLRAINDPTADLADYTWSSNTFIIPTDTVRFVGIEYNAGTPQAVVRTTNVWDLNTEFPLGLVVNDSNVLYLVNKPHAVTNFPGLTLQRFYETHRYIRDEETGGLLVGETGTRNLTLSAGVLWNRLSRFSITAKDTSVADTFDSYYRDGVGGFTQVTAQTQWDNLNYDNGTGTLAALPAGTYGIHWVYVMADDTFALLYGVQAYASSAEAETVQNPTTLPDRLRYMGTLVGRIVFAQGAASAIRTQSSFDHVFPPVSGALHNNLGSLQGGTVTERYHATATQAAALAGTAGTPSDTNRYVTDQDTRLIPYDPRVQLIFDHMISSNIDADEYGKQGWRVVASGSGAALNQTGEAGHPGIAVLVAGTANNGYATIYAGSTAVGGNIVVGGTNDIAYECLVKFTLSIAQTDLELGMMGFGLEWTLVGELTNGVYVRFNPAVTNVFAVVASTGGVRSNSNGTTPVVLDTWYRVGFVISNPGTTPSIQLYVNGVAEGTPVTTNIPTIPLGVGQKIDSAGGTGTNLLVDYVSLTQDSDLED